MTFPESIPTDYRNQIIVGDALELLRTLPDESVPMFLFSPPYNMGYTTGGGMKQYKIKRARTPSQKTWYGAALANGYDGNDDAMPMNDYIAWLQAVIQECWRCLSPRGGIYFNHKQRILNGVCYTPLEYVPSGVTVRQVVIRQCAGGIGFNHKFYCPTHEWIVILAKDKWQLRDRGASGVGDVWYIPQESGTWHPAPFPLALATRALETVMPAFVVDPFMGSGTTAKAAAKLGIGYIGFELSESYAARARKEIADIAAQPRLIPIEATQEKLAL